ncbi:MAG: hypothetical protein ACYDAR_00790 [Thermomicrobiales bacterium]
MVIHYALLASRRTSKRMNAISLLSVLAGRVRCEPLIGTVFIAYGASLIVLAALGATLRLRRLWPAKALRGS